jgi:hypothetical protein
MMVIMAMARNVERSTHVVQVLVITLLSAGRPDLENIIVNVKIILP